VHCRIEFKEKEMKRHESENELKRKLFIVQKFITEIILGTL